MILVKVKVHATDDPLKSCSNEALRGSIVFGLIPHNVNVKRHVAKFGTCVAPLLSTLSCA